MLTLPSFKDAVERGKEWKASYPSSATHDNIPVTNERRLSMRERGKMGRRRGRDRWAAIDDGGDGSVARHADHVLSLTVGRAGIQSEMREARDICMFFP